MSDSIALVSGHVNFLIEDRKQAIDKANLLGITLTLLYDLAFLGWMVDILMYLRYISDISARENNKKFI
jgi:hypothetical protein